MKITLLSKEESDALVESMYTERMEWTTEQIIADAKFMKSLPDMGNTKYIIGEENWNNFFQWLRTEEARQEWNKTPHTLHLTKYYNERNI